MRGHDISPHMRNGQLPDAEGYRGKTVETQATLLCADEFSDDCGDSMM